MTTANDILKQIKENDVKFVDLRFTDPKGKLHHVTMDVVCVDEDMFADGVMFDGSSIGGWKAINESDMVMMPDPATAHMDPFFAQGVNAGQGALRRCAAQGILSGIPLPVFTAACAYLDGWRGAPVGANLIQAQRDLFGAHTYRRTDREGVFHHEWRRDNG